MNTHQTSNIKQPSAKIARLLARHLKATEKGRAHYEKAASALEEALACAPPLDAAITLRTGETVMIVDNLGGRAPPSTARASSASA